MELILTLLSIGIACLIVARIVVKMDDYGDNALLVLLQRAGMGIGVFILTSLLPLAILVKLVQYFWNF